MSGCSYRFLSSSLLLVRIHLLGLASADPLLLPLPEDTAAASVSTQPPLVSLVGWLRAPEHVENIFGCWSILGSRREERVKTESFQCQKQSK